ncbi:MAG: homoaconitate hydratase [Candidatus Bathyarchaeia archaeon]
MGKPLVHDYVKDSIESGRASMPDSIRILDATLTEGEQTPGVVFSSDEKLGIARKLAEAGVDAAFVGFPAVSREEKRTAKTIINEGLGFESWGLCRVLKEDIDELIDIDCDMASFIAPASRLHYEKRLKTDLEDYLVRLEELASYTLEHGIGVSLGLEDASRAEMDDVERFSKIVKDKENCNLLITDTVGTFTPSSARYYVDQVRQFWSKPLALHFHDDFGMATANTLAALEAGKGEYYLYLTVNGIGERCGAASLEETCAALKILYGYNIRFDLTKLMELSRLVERYSSIPVIPTKAIVGLNAFTHETGPHVHGIMIDPLTYERIPIESLGRKRRFVFGKHTGASLIKRVLEEKGIECDKQSLEVILQQVKERHEKKDARWKVKNNKIIESYHKSVEERFTLEDEVLEIARKVLKL